MVGAGPSGKMRRMTRARREEIGREEESSLEQEEVDEDRGEERRAMVDKRRNGSERGGEGKAENGELGGIHDSCWAGGLFRRDVGEEERRVR